MNPTNDSQVVEILGRNRLINELLLAGIEVAIPVRDKGVDLIAFVERNAKVQNFAAFPIQLKASSTRGFGLDKKYSRIANLIIAYVWHVDSEGECATYALTYPEALQIADELGWTKTSSWEKGTYVSTSPSRKLCELLEPFKMTGEKWWSKIHDLAI